MAAASLKEAAQDAFPNLNTLWIANTMKTNIASFCDAALAIFVDQDINGHPVANWTILLDAAQAEMPGTNVSFLSLVAAADQLYRLCWIGSYLHGAGLIKAAQATSLLAAYNTAFT